MNTPLPPRATADEDLRGQQLAGYRIKHRIGRGGMADVYLAEQESLRRAVAVKVLHRSLSSDASYVLRFQNEAHSAASLIHGNIVQIYEVGSVGNFHFIAQEYIDGQNVGQVLVRHGPIAESLAVNMLIQVAAALQKAADAGIVHRDIKPENIMVTKEGEVKVADFGLARMYRDDQAVNLTKVGMTLGTPLYMSPEQVEGKVLDTRSDIYSLGVTAFHMLVGHAPFQGDNAFTVAVKHLKEDPPQLQDLMPSLSPELCDIVHRMIQKDRDKRFQSPRELLNALRGLAAAKTGDDHRNGSHAWNSPELATLVRHHLESTQRLETVLLSQPVETVKGTRRWPFVLLALFTFAIGSAAAWTGRPKSLLQTGGAEPIRIERKATVREQYWFAMEVNTIEAWQSVEAHFPPGESKTNRLYAFRAKQRLADLLYEQRAYDPAKMLYEQLAQLDPDTEVEFVVAGLVGQAKIHAQNEEITSARQIMAQVAKLRPKLRQQNAQIADELSKLLDRRLRAIWEELLKDK